jgi:cell division protein ZapB
LADENKLLRQQQASLLTERDTLLEKNAQARARIETMITRLKAVENGTSMP